MGAFGAFPRMTELVLDTNVLVALWLLVIINIFLRHCVTRSWFCHPVNS